MGAPKDFSSNFKRLQRLDLSSNQLSEFPIILKHLKQLQVLRLIRNNIETIPADFCEEEDIRDNLQELTINSNPLKEVPGNINLLKKLKILGIAYTAVKDLPSSIVQMEDHLQQLNVVGNTLHEPSQVLAERGVAAIIDYFVGQKDDNPQNKGEGSGAGATPGNDALGQSHGAAADDEGAEGAGDGVDYENFKNLIEQ